MKILFGAIISVIMVVLFLLYILVQNDLIRPVFLEEVFRSIASGSIAALGMIVAATFQYYKRRNVDVEANKIAMKIIQNKLSEKKENKDTIIESTFDVAADIVEHEVKDWGNKENG